jgi:hypothetical protein
MEDAMKTGRCDRHGCDYYGPLNDCLLFFLCPACSGDDTPSLDDVIADMRDYHLANEGELTVREDVAICDWIFKLEKIWNARHH